MGAPRRSLAFTGRVARAATRRLGRRGAVLGWG